MSFHKEHEVAGELSGRLTGYRFEKELEPGASIWDEAGKYSLEKCPFCGEAPEWAFTEDEEGDLQWSVFCHETTCHVCPMATWSDSEEFAALKWNRRADKKTS